MTSYIPALEPSVLLTLLRLSPLLTTTASLTHAYMESLTVSSFLSAPPTTSSLSRSLLAPYTANPTANPNHSAVVASAHELSAPVWFVNFFHRGVWSVIGLNTLTLLSTSANLWLYGEGLGDSRNYYLTGLAAAVAHYAFVPLVSHSVAHLYRLCAAQEKGDEEEVKRGKGAVESVREWVGWHRVRMGSVDVLAWGAFLVGVGRCVGAQ